MAVEFSEMPVNYGLKYAFDSDTYNSGNVWENYVGGTNATLQNASKAADGSVFFPSGDGFGYWVNDDTSYTDSTKYIICKAINTPSESSYYWLFTERGSSNSYTTDIDVYGTDGTFALYVNGKAVKTAIIPSDYHVIATVKSGTVATLYIDGKQVAQMTGKTAFNPTNYGINVASGTGNTPTESSQNTYVRCAVVCNSAHSAFEIKLNSDWLLIQYGLADKPLESKMSGADAAAIAWCIKQNLEQAKSIDLQKKAYKKGLQRGNEGGANIKEDYEQDGNNLDIDTDGDGRISEPFIGSLEEGIYYTDETGAYVHVWVDMSIVFDDMDSAVSPRIYTGSIVYDAYDSSGNHIAREVIGDRAGNNGWYHWKSVHKNGSFQYVYSLDINGADVRGHFVSCNADGEPLHYYSYDVSPWNDDVESIMGNAVKVGNIPPDIIS